MSHIRGYRFVPPAAADLSGAVWIGLSELHQYVSRICCCCCCVSARSTSLPETRTRPSPRGAARSAPPQTFMQSNSCSDLMMFFSVKLNPVNVVPPVQTWPSANGVSIQSRRCKVIIVGGSGWSVLRPEAQTQSATIICEPMNCTVFVFHSTVNKTKEKIWRR